MSEPPAARASEPARELDAAEMEAAARLWRAAGREVVCRFGGTSMTPAVPDRAEVRLHCGEKGAPGDVMAVLSTGRLLVHRIVAASDRAGWILTCGDARLVPDAPILRAEDVIGRVAAVRRGERFEAPAPFARSLPRRALLWPLVAALRVRPSAGAALIRAVLAVRRRAIALSARLRTRRVSAGRPAP